VLVKLSIAARHRLTLAKISGLHDPTFGTLMPRSTAFTASEADVSRRLHIFAEPLLHSMSARGRFRTHSSAFARGRLSAHSRHREGCGALIARCHVAEGTNNCNAISSMQFAEGLINWKFLRPTCNALGGHEIFSAPWCGALQTNTGENVDREIFPKEGLLD